MTEPSKTSNASSFGFYWFLGVGVAWYFLFSPSSNHFVMNSEAAVNGYALAAELYPTLTPAGQEKIARMYEKGFLTRTDVSRIIDVTLYDRNDGKGVAVQPTSLFGDSSEGSFESTWMWRELTGELSSSNSKAKFESVLAASGVSWSSPKSRDRSLCEVLLPWCSAPLKA